MKRHSFILGLALTCAGSCAADDEVILPTGVPNDPGPKPERNKQGGYDCILESIKRAQVTEIKPKNILKYCEPEKESAARYSNGKSTFVYWTILIDFKVDTVFGNEKSSARAFVRNQRVHVWLYAGSGEIVP